PRIRQRSDGLSGTYIAPVLAAVLGIAVVVHLQKARAQASTLLIQPFGALSLVIQRLLKVRDLDAKAPDALEQPGDLPLEVADSRLERLAVVLLGPAPGLARHGKYLGGAGSEAQRQGRARPAGQLVGGEHQGPARRRRPS